MTPAQVKQVQQSWAIVSSYNQTGDRIYDRLVDIHPEVIPLFDGDMQEQGQKLVMMISMAVDGLDNLDELKPKIMESGYQHAKLGVSEDDYDKVAEALRWTLAYIHRNEFTEELQDAWSAAYGEIASIMKRGARAAGV